MHIAGVLHFEPRSKPPKYRAPGLYIRAPKPKPPGGALYFGGSIADIRIQNFPDPNYGPRKMRCFFCLPYPPKLNTVKMMFLVTFLMLKKPEIQSSVFSILY